MRERKRIGCVGRWVSLPEKIRSASHAASLAGGLLALAYPDRVAQRRAGNRARFLLRNGRGAELAGGQTLSTSPYIVAAELDDQRPESRIFLAASTTLDEIREAFATQIVVEDVVEFDNETDGVVARKRERLGAIVLRETSVMNPDPALVPSRARRRSATARDSPDCPWSDAARRLRERLAFVGQHEPGWPAVTDDALGATLDEWLSPALNGVAKWRDVERVDLVAALSSLIDWRQRRALDELAPTHIEVPTARIARGLLGSCLARARGSDSRVVRNARIAGTHAGRGDRRRCICCRRRDGRCRSRKISRAFGDRATSTFAKIFAAATRSTSGRKTRPPPCRAAVAGGRAPTAERIPDREPD